MNKSFRSLAVIVMTVVLATFGAFVWTNGERLQQFLRTSIIESDLIDLTNESRSSADLEELAISPVLKKAAQAKAEDMAAKSYFSHTGPDGRIFTDWLKENDYDYLYAGENLAVKFRDSSAVTAAWLKSPKHKANLLSSNFTEIGIGIAEGYYKGKKTTFVVQFFGQPKIPNILRATGESVVARGMWADSDSEEMSISVATRNELDIDALGDDFVTPLLLKFLPLL
jgi:hypothetical protein